VSINAQLLNPVYLISNALNVCLKYLHNCMAFCTICLYNLVTSLKHVLNARLQK